MGIARGVSVEDDWGPRLMTERLVARMPAADDSLPINRILNDWEVARWLARVPHPCPLKITIERCQQYYPQRMIERCWVLCDRTDPEQPVVGLVVCGWPDGPPEMGFWMARSHWGRGLMTEALKSIIAAIFDITGAESIEAGVFVGNEASLRVQEKLGFVTVGTNMCDNLALGRKVEHIETRLTRRAFEEAVR